jgi:hypothetical protein
MAPEKTITKKKVRIPILLAGVCFIFLLVRNFAMINCKNVDMIEALQSYQSLQAQTVQPTRKPRHHPTRADSVLRDFASDTSNNSDKSHCDSKDPYRHIPLKPNQRVIHLTGKMGYNNKFQKDVEDRQREVIQKFPWLRNTSDAISHFKVPDHWLNYEPYQEHLQFLKDPTHESSKGGGWWFWKPAVILDVLKQLSPDDVLVYADYDQTNWWPGLAVFIEYMIQNPNIDWALTQTYIREEKYTKQDVFEAYCGKPTKALQDSGQWRAGLHIFRPTPRVIQFIEEWQRATEDYSAISDTESLIPNAPSFVEHRRDQSLLNLLLKCWFTSDEAKYVKVLDPCEGLYMKGNLNLHFVTLPSLKTPEELTLLEERRHSFWASHNRTVPKAVYQT